MNWPLLILSLAAIGAPSGALMLDRIKGYSVRRFVKTQGLPALVVFLGITVYALVGHDPLLELIKWGLVGGLAATVTLDAVRFVGVKLGQFPMDMPTMFGTIATGLSGKLMKNVMAGFVQRLAQLTEDERRRAMEARVRWMATLPEEVRRFVMGGMVKGLNRLSTHDRDKVMKTQLEVLSTLESEQRMRMMRTMDALIMGIGDGTPITERPPLVQDRPPQMAMEVFRDLAVPALRQTLLEEKVSLRKVRFWGYLWHVVNGATYGIAFTLLFGMGSWPLAFGWGIFVDLVMMVGMPKMMPMIRLPFPRFLLVPYLAHVAMAVPIGYFALTYVTREVTQAASLFGPLLLSLGGDAFLGLTVVPLLWIAISTAVIVGGYRQYGKPYSDVPRTRLFRPIPVLVQPKRVA